jgi:hypothetical protein
MKSKNINLLILTVCLLFSALASSFSQSTSITGDTEPCINTNSYYILTAPPPPSGFIAEGVDWFVNGQLTVGNGGFATFVYVDANKSIRAVSKNYRTTQSGEREYSNFEASLSATPRNLSAALSEISSPISSIECGQTPTLTFSITASGINSSLSYSWNLPSGWTLVSAMNSSTIQVQAGPNTGGVVGVTVTDTKCNTSVFRQTNIVRSIPTLGAISGGAGCFCAGQTQQYSVPAVNGATNYVWTASGSLSIAGGQGTNTVSVGSSGSGGTISAFAVTPCGNTNTVGSYYISSSSSSYIAKNIFETYT